MRKTECFKIRLYSTGNLDFSNLDMSNPIKDVEFGDGIVKGHPIQIVADPFLFVFNNTLFLFYESKRFRDKDLLMMTFSKDLKLWSKPVVVLKESFHLSYPFIFEQDGHVYMIPETNQAHAVRLYEADDSTLTHFTYKRDLLSHKSEDSSITIDYCDTSVLKKEGVYYMHTTVCYNGINTLELYTSETLFGPYVKLPSSPIIADNKYGRNADSLISIGDTLYSVAQDCVKRYGDNVHLFRIDELTPNSYRETLVKDNIKH